jgi:hypothetical protein
MTSFCIASPHKNVLWYDYQLYVNLKQELQALGFQYRSASRNRIYFLGAPQLQFYPEVGKFDSSVNNIAVLYSHAEKLQALNQFNQVFVCSEGVKRLLNKKRLLGFELFKKDKPFTARTAIEILRPFSSLKPSNHLMPKYDCDISFIGTPRIRPILEEALPIAHAMGLKIKIYGPNWDQYQGNALAMRYWVANSVPYTDIPKLAKGSKICLIDHHESMNQIGAVSHKYVDFVMAGAFVISDNNRDAVRHYKGLCFNKNLPLDTLISKYLEDSAQRRSHVTRQQKIIAEQTTLHAAQKIAEYFVNDE